MPNSSIWRTDRNISVATTPGQSQPGRDGNKRLLRIPQSSCITGASPSDCLVLYPGHSLGKSHLSADMQSVYSAAPTDLVKIYIYIYIYMGDIQKDHPKREAIGEYFLLQQQPLLIK